MAEVTGRSGLVGASAWPPSRWATWVDMDRVHSGARYCMDLEKSSSGLGSQPTKSSKKVGFFGMA